MIQFEAELLGNRVLAPSWRELILSWKPEAEPPLPGQFFTIRVSDRFDPLLRRPFAFASLAEDRTSISALYQLRGSATLMLADKARASSIDMIGPLGRGFSRPKRGSEAFLIGGGLGLGPILFLARSLAAGEQQSPARLVLGFRSADLIPRLDFPPGAIICTDDGSAGFHGRVTDWLQENAAPKPASIRACGPPAMLAALARFSMERGWDTELSAEQWMACGVGACMGCVLPKAEDQGFLRACADGPVFGAAEIDWASESRRQCPGTERKGVLA